jgi:adenine phosphoribosyltransferase
MSLLGELMTFFIAAIYLLIFIWLYIPVLLSLIASLSSQLSLHIRRLDARGFVLGPPIALQLQKPFIMMRKQGKMPNAISTNRDYQTEYGNREGLTVQRDKILPGQRVLIIDDLVATGGTLSSAMSLVKLLNGIVVECACIVELKLFIDPTDESGIPSRTKLLKSLGHDDIPIWGLISEDVLTVEGTLTSDYVDDGEEH